MYYSLIAESRFGSLMVTLTFSWMYIFSATSVRQETAVLSHIEWHGTWLKDCVDLQTSQLLSRYVSLASFSSSNFLQLETCCVGAGSARELTERFVWLRGVMKGQLSNPNDSSAGAPTLCSTCVTKGQSTVLQSGRSECSCPVTCWITFYSWSRVLCHVSKCLVAWTLGRNWTSRLQTLFLRNF